MALSWNEIKSRAIAFSKTWEDAANEDSEAKPFWIDFFEIFGITNRRVATFELNVKKHGGGQGFVDLFWPGMLLVEQKSRGKNLDKAFSQALDYFPGIPERDLPQLVIVSDFARFRVYNLETSETTEFDLKDLHKNIRLFGFIAGYKVQDIRAQNPVNIKAAERMGKLYDALKASGYDGHALEVLLVRLLFCLYADDTGIFQPANVLRTYIEERTAVDGSDLGSHLAKLFQVLNTEEEKRSTALDEQLAQFPYVNGGLFQETLPIADFTSAMREQFLDACALDWSAISPAIFGSLFQSIMDVDARRNLGAHYTSEENILKLIKPLFLDDLYAEFEKIRKVPAKLQAFHKKLRSLKFLDPACGCGNFLVISYRELRALELEVIRASQSLTAPGQQTLDVQSLIQVDVDQFYGIEIEEFPAQIAQVALWLVDHQANLKVSEEFGDYFARIPLRTTPHIVHGNALRLNWNDVLPAIECTYVLGNPPFIGHQYRTPDQVADMDLVWGQDGRFGRLDFVTCWYKRVTEYMQSNHSIYAAFVSTNSICQGEQVGTLWGYLLEQGIHINFAHRPFSWSNEARANAGVHCVIVGLSLSESKCKTLFEYLDVRTDAHAVKVRNINPYLVEADDILLPSRTSTPVDRPQLIKGSQPTCGGNLVMSDTDKIELLKSEPAAEKWLKRFMGGEELINGGKRWCLWLKDAKASDLANLPQVQKRLKAVAAARLQSPTKSVQEFAKTPMLFTQDRQPSEDYVAVPEVSSESRLFVPIDFLSKDVIASNKLQIIAGGKLVHFGLLSSSMHNAWIRTVAGRLESRISYSPAVYNNMPWPDLVGDQKAKIETAAQAVLDARHEDSEATLADLYDPTTMPPDLVKAHTNLDKAVDAAYGYKGGKDDAARLAFLFTQYQQTTSLLPTDIPKKIRKSKS